MAAETDKVEPGESEEEDVYEVERIIDMRVEEGEVLYRVRWKNYCSDDDTWEPEAHLEDCREVLLTYKKSLAEAKAKKEAEAKKSVKVLPTKSDIFDADGDSDSDKDRPSDLPVKKKKKKVEEPPPKEKKKKKKEKRRDEIRPLPAPETDEDTAPSPPPSPKKPEPKKRVVDSEDEEEPVPTKKNKKEKGKEMAKQRQKVEEGKKKKGKKEVKIDTSDDDTAPIEDDISEAPSDTHTDEPGTEGLKTTDRLLLDEKFKEKKGKWQVKLQGFKDLIQMKESKKADSSPKESSLQKLKMLTAKAKEDPTPHSSDSSDSSTAHRKSKSKDSTAPPKAQAASAASAASLAFSGKAKEEKTKEDTPEQKDSAGSTNLFEKFLLNCEAKDRAPRRPPVHQPPPEKSTSKPSKIIGKIEKISKTKDSPAQKTETERRTEKFKQSEAASVSKAGQSYGFSLDSDERGEEFSPKSRAGDEARRERSEEAQGPGWDRDRRSSTDSKPRRREDSEPRLFMACEDPTESQESAEPSDKTEKSQATLNLGMDLNLDWMTLEDFQKHLNGEDEVLSGPPLSPSELRDAVRNGDYMAVKLALNSKEDYNLDQERKKRRLTVDKRKNLMKQGRCSSDTRSSKSVLNATTRSKTAERSYNTMACKPTINLRRLRSRNTENNAQEKLNESSEEDADNLANSEKCSKVMVKQQPCKKNQETRQPTRRGLRNRKEVKPASSEIVTKGYTKLCKTKQEDEEPPERAKKARAQRSPSQLPSVSEFLIGDCKEIVRVMHQDDISRHICHDPFICKYGNALSVKYDHDKVQFTYIGQKMRELSRFVLAVKELDSSVHGLREICLPSKFELAVEGAKKVSGYDPSSSTYKTVSLVTKIGYALKRAAEIAFEESRMMGDSESESDIKTFIELLDSKWNDYFPHKDLASPQKQEVMKAEVDTSTVTVDLLKLHLFITQEEEEARKELLQNPSLSMWKKLSEATLSDVCLFNRLRVGNIGRLLLEMYTSKQSTGKFVPSAEQMRKSTKLELELGERLTRLELEGQFGRSMLVLLTERMVSLIDLLLDLRESVGVSENNVYLFARSEGPSFIRGLDCLRRVAAECGVANPEALLCPSLREQVANSWQLMSLCDSELDQVATLLGRSTHEFREISKNPTLVEEVSIQLLQMNRIITPSTTSPAKEGAQSKSAVKRRPWSEKEQAAVKRFLSEFLTKMKVPGKKECNACLAAEPDLCRRSWTDVKNFVHNTLQTLKRRQNQPQTERRTVTPKRPKAVSQSTKKQVHNNNVGNLATINLDGLRDSMNMSLTPPSHAIEQSTLFSQDMTSGYPSNCLTNMPYTNPTSSSFLSPNVLDTQVVPTYSPLNPANSVMHPLYSAESRYMPLMSPPHTHNPSSVHPPSVYSPQDTASIPTFTSLNGPSTSMHPTYASLNTVVFPPYPAVNERNDTILYPYTPLNHSSTSFPTSPTIQGTSSQVVPTVHTRTLAGGPADAEESISASSEHLSTLVKSQIRNKRLWREEELGDLCELVSLIESEMQAAHSERDAPIYTSL